MKYNDEARVMMVVDTLAILVVGMLIGAVVALGFGNSESRILRRKILQRDSIINAQREVIKQQDERIMRWMVEYEPYGAMGDED